MAYCAVCETQTKDGHRFCRQCGAPVTILQPDRARQPANPHARQETPKGRATVGQRIKRREKLLLFVGLPILSIIVWYGIILPATDVEREIGKAIEKLEQSRTSIEAQQQAKVHYNSAVEVALEGQFEAALSELDKAISLDPTLSRAYYTRGFAYFEMGDPLRAIEDYTRAISLDTDYTAAYNMRGLAFARLGQYERGIQDYGKAIRLESNNSLAFGNRCTAYYGLELFALALQDCDAAIKLDPENAELYENRGLVYRQMGKFVEADREFARAKDLERAQ